MTNVNHCKIRRLFPEWCSHILRQTECWYTISHIVETIAETAYKRYQANRRLTRAQEEYATLWDDLDIEKICDIRIEDNHVTQKVLKILTQSFNTYREYLNNSINDILDIGFVAFHERIESDLNFKNETMLLLNDEFAEKHNELIRLESRNEEIGIPNAIKCVVENTTQNQYRFWRQKVGRTLNFCKRYK